MLARRSPAAIGTRDRARTRARSSADSGGIGSSMKRSLNGSRAAEQLVDGQAVVPALDVPEGDVDRAPRGGLERAADPEAVAVHLLGEVLDRPRIAADERLAELEHALADREVVALEDGLADAGG